MSEITKRKKGQMLNNSERQLILNLMNYLKSKNSEKSNSEIIREISKATGCSERTIYKIKKEASKGITVVTNKKRSRKKENKNSRNVKYDSFVKSSIRRKIYSFFLQNSSPTLNTILCLVNGDPDLPNFKRSTLHTLLKEIGFIYEQKGKKSFLTESKDLVELRQAYLKHLRQFRNENRWIVYTGETIISLVNNEIIKNKSLKCSSSLTGEEKCENFEAGCGPVNKVVINTPEPTSGETVVYTIDATALGSVLMAETLQLRGEIAAVQQNSPNTENTPIPVEDSGLASVDAPQQREALPARCLRKPSKELRLSVMHAGSDEGLIQDADYITVSKKKVEDAENYKHWFLEKLLPKVPPNSVVVTDLNASHHKVEENFPDGSWKKQQIKEWLLTKNIKADHLSQKKELLSAVNQVRPTYCLSYKISEVARERGITILSLPPFHYELNPLNMVWAQIKYYVRSNIRSLKVRKIKQLIRESLYSTSQFNWVNYLHHVREGEDLLWTIDKHQEALTGLNSILRSTEEEPIVCDTFNSL